MECKGCSSVISTSVKLNYEREEVDTLAGKVFILHVKCPCCEFEIDIQTCPVLPGYCILKGAEEHPKRNMSSAAEERYRMIYSKIPRGEGSRPSEKPPRLLLGVAKRHNA